MIVIGIDPGTAITGYGVVEKSGDRVCYIDCGVFRTTPDFSAPDRLKTLYDQFNQLLDRHHPAEAATERLFFTNNTTTGIPVGRALGVILLTLAQRGIPWTEYTPTQVKNAVVGTGRADKQQVQFMVTRLLGLPKAPTPDDAADALGIAICHAHSLRPGLAAPAVSAAAPARPVRRGVRG